MGGTRGAGAVCTEHQPSQGLVFSSAVKVHDQELNRDVWQQLSWYVIDEGFIKDRVERALLHMRFLFGNALVAIEHV